MRKTILAVLAVLTVSVSCRQQIWQPRPTLPLVLSISADSTGLGRLAAQAGRRGPEGSIAIIGEPSDAITLGHRFLAADRVDNVDGREVRDSLPDFAGERFDVILDAYNEPYSHFYTEDADAVRRLDSLREAAVHNALFAWDSTCVRSAASPDVLLAKSRAKILIFTSSMQAEYGLFDVDTLQQLSGGRSILLSPVEILLDQAFESGARHLAVWTSRSTRKANAWQAVFERKNLSGATLTVITPEAALDIRTEFRNFLRQYRTTGHRLDALILDSYTANLPFLNSELELIRRSMTEEDASFNKMLSPTFCFLDPQSAIVRATYELLRERNLFTHSISRPVLQYYETSESEDGQPLLVEVGTTYVQHAYVQNDR